MADTTIYLLQGVDLSSDYVNTIDFLNASAQASFFSSKAIKTIADATFQRLDSGDRVIRVKENVENLRNVNYVMFQNELGGKWYYGFVTNIVFQSPTVSHVFYEVDVMQTWMFEMDIKDSFVEREHTSTDVIFEHLVDEGLEIGELTVNSTQQLTSLDELLTIVAVTEAWDGASSWDPVSGYVINGVYSGARFYWFDQDEVLGLAQLNSFLEKYVEDGKQASVISIFMLPKTFISTGGADYGVITAQSTVTVNTSITTPSTTLDGYLPRNRKLYSYPYSLLYVLNNNGAENIYRWEYSADPTKVDFELKSDVQPAPTSYLIPKNYKGNFVSNYDELMTLSDFPVCVWTTDSFAQWFGANKGSLAIQGALSAGAIIGGAATGTVPVIAGGVAGVAGIIGQFRDQSVKSPQVRGKFSGTSNVAVGIQQFIFLKKSIRAEHARIIDEYFDMFGYKVNRVKTPNLRSRTAWNYIKMRNANIYGNISQQDLDKIRSIFNAGITFWHGDFVGDYSQNNTV